MTILCENSWQSCWNASLSGQLPSRTNDGKEQTNHVKINKYPFNNTPFLRGTCVGKALISNSANRIAWALARYLPQLATERKQSTSAWRVCLFHLRPQRYFFVQSMPQLSTEDAANQTDRALVSRVSMKKVALVHNHVCASNLHWCVESCSKTKSPTASMYMQLLWQIFNISIQLVHLLTTNTTVQLLKLLCL